MIVLVPKLPENNTNTAKKTFLKIFDFFTEGGQREFREWEKLESEPQYFLTLMPLFRGEYLMDKYAVCGIRSRNIIAKTLP